MKLRYSPTSPYVRKVTVTAIETGLNNRIERILTMTVFVACVPDFVEQPVVADGASRVLQDIFGDAGRHTRSAIGVAALPRGAPVEVEITAALRPDRE